MIRTTLDRIVILGAQEGAPPRQNRRVRLVNVICLFVIAVILPHLALTVYFDSARASWIQCAAITHLSLAIVLNARGHYRSARLLALVVGNLHIFNMVVIFGPECGVHFYYPAAVIAPLFFHDRSEAKQVMGFVALSVGLALLNQASMIEPLIAAPPILLRAFFYLSVIGALLTVTSARNEHSRNIIGIPLRPRLPEW